MADWIRCKDKLPPIGEMVWVTIWGSDIVLQHDGETIIDAIDRQQKELRRVSLGFYAEDGDQKSTWMDWFDADGLPMIVKPVAWMPMDKPAEPWQGDNSDA